MRSWPGPKTTRGGPRRPLPAAGPPALGRGARFRRGRDRGRLLFAGDLLLVTFDYGTDRILNPAWQCGGLCEVPTQYHL